MIRSFPFCANTDLWFIQYKDNEYWITANVLLCDIYKRANEEEQYTLLSSTKIVSWLFITSNKFIRGTTIQQPAVKPDPNLANQTQLESVSIISYDFRSIELRLAICCWSNSRDRKIVVDGREV